MGVPFLDIASVAMKVIDRFVPDPKAKAAAEAAVREMDNERLMQALGMEADMAKGQMEINKIEAASESLFVAGWRPFCGWSCGVAMAYHFMLQPLLAFVIANAGYNVVLPAFDMDTLLTVLLGILGLGGLRSIEKVKGIANK